MSSIAVFITGFFIDVLYVLWIAVTNRDKALSSAALSTLITACGIYGWVNIAERHDLAIPYLCGVFFGGIVGIWLKKRLVK